MDGRWCSSSRKKNQVDGPLLLYLIVIQRLMVVEQLATENETLLLGRNAFHLANLCLHVLDGVVRVDFKGERLRGQGFHIDLHDAL